jgi:hypothetical protein
VLEWRCTGRAVLSHFSALRDGRAGAPLSLSLARVFVSRGARVASKGLRGVSEGSSMGAWTKGLDAG